MNESTLVPREEMSDLDWLARNVHVWDSDFGFIAMLKMNNGDNIHVYIRGGSKLHPYYVGDAMKWQHARPYSKAQWLSRRAELQNKPSFADHPDAKCFAQRKDGKWFKNTETSSVYSTASGEWMELMIHGGWIEICQGEVLGDWRGTLEKLPCAHNPRSEMSTESIEEISKGMQKNWDELEQFVNADCPSKIPAHSNQPKPSTDIYKCAEVKQFEPFVSVEDIGAATETAGQQYRREIQEIALNKYNDAMKDAATAKQPAPKGSGSPILGMVLADLTNRALEGKEKYGEPLLAHNGRNPLWDAYQEALDLAMYLRQAIEEQK